MVVIALYGSANTGKTRTLRLLIDQLINQKGIFIEPTGIKPRGDVRCCIETSDKKRICITTAGDDGETQKDNKLFVANLQGVDIWITASRNSGGSVDEIWKNTSQAFPVNEVIWIHKISCEHVYRQFKGNWNNYSQVESNYVKESDYDFCNAHDAQRIARLI